LVGFPRVKKQRFVPEIVMESPDFVPLVIDSSENVLPKRLVSLVFREMNDLLDGICSSN
jgi:hypothetical protein